MPPPDFIALEQKYGLPPGFLAAQQQVESGGRDVTSSAGANGPAQLMPATARALGVNPHDPLAAAEAQARLMRQNLDATGGDIDRAAMMYHGGPNTRIWGPKTNAYPGKILAALSGQATPTQAPAPRAPSDPIEAAIMGGHPNSAPTANDPIEAAILGGTSASDAHPGQHGNNGGPNAGVGVRPGIQAGAGNSPAEAVPGAIPQQAFGGSAQQRLLNGVGGALGDIYRGVGDGWDAAGNSLVGLVDRGTDALGLTTGAHDRYNKFLAGDDAARQARMNTPDGWAGSIGHFIGNTIPSLAVSELKPFTVAEGAGGLAAGLARYANMATQGAVVGTANSGGNNIVHNAEMGALAAPLVGAGIEKVAVPGIMAAGHRAGALADGLAKMTGSAGNSAATQASEASIESMINSGATAAEIRAAHPEALSNVDSWVAWRAAGHKGPVNFETGKPLPIDPAEVQSAMGSRGDRLGVEGGGVLPQAVNDHAAMLKQQGVPVDQAIREARLKAIGAEPTTANVTRDPVALRGEVEGAKLNTPEGQTLAAQRARNNSVVVNGMADTARDFSPTGNVPQPGEAMQASAEALVKASDAAKLKVSRSYADARASDGDQRVSIDGLREMLDKNAPEYQTTAEGAKLVEGLRTRIEAMTAKNAGRFSPEEIDILTKAANDAYNPMGGGANGMVGQVKSSLNESLDQFDKAGPAFREARNLHRQWAQRFDDPKGVKNLILRDASGNFVNADKWRAQDGLLTQTNDKPAMQIFNALDQTGAHDELGLLKSHVAHHAYEAATGRNAGNAVDALNNSPVSGKAYHTFLNKVGSGKLGALYTPEELAGMNNLGHSANIINETPVGVANNSGSSAALINALAGATKAQGTGGKAKILAHALPVAGGLIDALIGGGGLHGMVGGGAADALAQGIASAAQKRATAKASAVLAEQLTQAGSPAAARQATASEFAAQQAAAARASLARAIAGQSAAPSQSYRRSAN